jgi:hypothetical protein
MLRSAVGIRRSSVSCGCATTTFLVPPRSQAAPAFREHWIARVERDVRAVSVRIRGRRRHSERISSNSPFRRHRGSPAQPFHRRLPEQSVAQRAKAGDNEFMTARQMSTEAESSREDRNTLLALAVFVDRRTLVMLAPGFSAGLPLLLIFDTLSAWLRVSSLSLEVIIGQAMTIAGVFAGGLAVARYGRLAELTKEART